MTRQQLIDFAWHRIYAHYAKLYFPYRYKTWNVSLEKQNVFSQVRHDFDDYVYFNKRRPKAEFERSILCLLIACDDMEDLYLYIKRRAYPAMREEWRILNKQAQALFVRRDIL